MDTDSPPVSVVGTLLTFVSAAAGLAGALLIFAVLAFIGPVTDKTDRSELAELAAWCAICLSLCLACGGTGTAAAHYFLRRRKKLWPAIAIQLTAAGLACGFAVVTLGAR